MTNPSTHNSVIEKVQDLLLDTQDVEDFLSQLVRQSAEALSGPRGKVLAGITLMRHRSAATVASSSEEAQRLDEVQYEFGDGPCLKSCREKVLIHVPDLEQDQTWPAYNRAIIAYGVRSVLAVPFELSGDTAVGVIIGQNRCTQEEAVRLLMSASSTRNMKLRDVAAKVVQSAGGGDLQTHFD